MTEDELIAGFVADVTALQPRSLDSGPRAAASKAAAAATARRLLRRWQESQRHYHTVEHLTEMLAALRALDGRQGVTGSLSNLAAWYHDAVYDPRRADNESASADLARTELTALGLPPEGVEKVARLVEETADHALPQPGSDSARVHDADLWILAAPAERYDGYCAQVRAEYAHVPDAEFRTGRAAILRTLADRPRLYADPPAGADWEARARANLARELDRLERPGA